MEKSRPITVKVPRCGVVAAESVHEESFDIGFHSHEHHELLYVYKGQLDYEENGMADPMLMSAGTLTAVLAGTRHRVRDRQPSTLLLLCFSKGFEERVPDLKELWRNLNARENRVIVLDEIPQRDIDLGFRRILAEQVNPRQAGSVAIQGVALDLLAKLAEVPDGRRENSARERVERVLASIEQRFFEPWSLDRAASEAQMSRRKFSQLFKEITGMTFLKKLTELRLEHAARELEKGKHTIVGAAFSCGFGDLTHFYRLFSKRYGMPPGRWRERH